MKVSRLLVVVGALWFIGCQQDVPPAKPKPVASAATAPTSSCGAKAPVTSVLAVPPQEMRRALADAYRLKPDKRFLLAIGDIHHFFVPSVPAKMAQAGFAEGKWRICYGEQTVGTLTELAGFDDWLGLLTGWARKLNSSHPITFNRAAPDAEDPQIEERLQRFDSSDALAVVRQINGKWKNDERAAADLPAVTRALTIISLQKLDRLEIADLVEARAITALTLAKSLTDRDVQREEALLARVFWDVNHAASVANRLAAEDPVRLFITEDDERLKVIARGRYGTPEARYLYLLRLAQMEDKKDFGYWQRDFFPNTLSLPVLKAALDLGDFDVNGGLARTLPYIVTATVAVEAGNFDFSLADLVGLFKDGEKQDAWRIGSRAKSLLRLDTQSLITRFESDIATLGRESDGVFMDSATTKSYYRAYFYSGLHVVGLHYLDALSSIEAVKYFSELLGQSETGIAADFIRWYTDLAQAKEGRVNLSRLRSDLTALPTLGVAPLRRTFEELSKTMSYGNPALFASAKELAARMDDRVFNRNALAGIAYSSLYDLHLAERLYRSSIQVSRNSNLIVWYAKFTGREKALVKILHSPKLHFGSRVLAIKYLKQLGATDSQVDEWYRMLVNEQPDNWDLLDVYIRFLEADKKYREAEDVAEHWLNRHGPRYGFPYIFATNALARQYEHEGRYQEGLEVMERVVSSGQSGAIENYALLLSKAGRYEDAEKWGRAVVARYPDVVRTRARLAEIYWRQGRYDDATKTIKESPRRISSLEWRDLIGGNFAKVFVDKPAEGLEAFSALRAAGISHFDLQQMVWPANDAGQHELAFKMSAQLTARGLASVEFLVRSYKLLKVWRGQAEALDWIRSRIPAQVLNPSSMIAYGESEFDLLWDLIQRPQDGEYPDAVWLYRAAASLREDGKNESHRQALEVHFKDTRGGFYHSLGRYLLGYASSEEVLPLATDNNKRCEAAYYMGLRALHDGRFNDGSDWYRVAVETGLINMGEYRWAYNELLRFVNDDLSLALRAQKQ